MHDVLSLPQAAQHVGLDPARFAELVSQNYFPPPIARDPACPEWSRTELNMRMRGADEARLEKMIASGLFAECEPRPTCARIETGVSVRTAKAAGAIHLDFLSFGARSYRRGPRDYRVWIPYPAHERIRKGVMRDLNARAHELEWYADAGLTEAV